MKSFFQKMKKEEGFTLVELMVVVAIIGLLSAVAVPNFKKYQAKSKISEAKLQLSAAYTAEQAFFSDYNMYAHCLPYMGYDPGNEASNRYYAIGFATIAVYNTGAYQAAQNSGLNNDAANGCPNSATVVVGSTTGNSGNNASWFPAGKGIGASIANAANGLAYLPPSTHGSQDVGQMTFTIGAGGVISQDFPANNQASQLTINERKVLTSVRNGY